MKKLISLFLILSITFIFPFYADAGNYDTIKIGLFFASTAKDEVSLLSNSGFNIGFEANGAFNLTQTLYVNQVTVKKGEENSIVLSYFEEDGTEKNVSHSDENTYLTIYPISGNITINSAVYRGGTQFRRMSGSDMTVINIVSMDEYLYSVLGREMSPSWPIEALKAQAVCARSYAVTNWNKFSKYGFNLCNTTVSQVYSGVSSEAESTIRATNETSGKLLKYNGAIANTLYFSSSGGATANSAHVWGGSIPYLTGVIDPYENPAEISRYSWEITLTQDEIKSILASRGQNIGDITALNTTRDDHGYVTELVFVGTNGTYSVKNTTCRDIFGARIHSQRYTVTGNGNSQNINMYVLSANGTSSQDSNSLYVNGVWKLPGSFSVLGDTTPQRYESAWANSVPTAFVFNGNGWGHGVGMSQWGAKGMADQGFTYDQILTFYYPGTYLE